MSTSRLTFPVYIRTQQDESCLVVCPEPPMQGSTVLTRVEYLVDRCDGSFSSVVFDMRHYKSFDSRNLAVIVALRRLFAERGVMSFEMINVPRAAYAVLDALGLTDYFSVTAA